jgi:hypothetical protein
MGFLVLLVLVALWIWWPKQKDPPRTASPKVQEFETKVVPSPTSASVNQRAGTPPTPYAPEENQRIKTTADIPQCTVTVRDGECAVCRSTRRARFVTPRARLCQWCVKGLNENAPIDVVALARVVDTFRQKVEDPGAFWQAVLNGKRSHQGIGRTVQQWGMQPEGASSTFWLKSLRAFQLGLISGGAACPRLVEDTWNALARQIRHADGYECQICHARGEELHVHHIMHLAHFGTNQPINLVTLCYQHHRSQHPDVLFSLDAPEEGACQEESL